MTLRPVSFKTPIEPQPRLSPPRTPGRRHSRFWTDEEKAIVRANYPSGGAAACQTKMPHRSQSHIYQQAAKLGLHFSGRVPRSARIASPPDLDAQITAAWPSLKGRGAVANLAERLGVPRPRITARATALGLTMPHQKEPAWTQAEVDLLRRIPLHDLKAASRVFAQHNFHRSPTSIGVKAKREQVSRRYKETFSASAIARILGIDGKTATTWIIAGDIKATKRPTDRLPQQGGDPWSVTRADLRDFIVSKLDRIDIRKVEKFAFVDLLTRADEPPSTPSPD